MLQDCAVESNNVAARLHHVAPPRLLDVALQFDAQRTVVEGRTEAAVNVASGKHQAAPLAQVDQLLHRNRVRTLGHGLCSIFSGQTAPSRSFDFRKCSLLKLRSAAIQPSQRCYSSLIISAATRPPASISRIATVPGTSTRLRGNVALPGFITSVSPKRTTPSRWLWPITSTSTGPPKWRSIAR